MALPTEFQFLGGAQSLEATWYTQQNFRRIELLFDKFIRNYMQSRAFQPTQVACPADTNEHDFQSTAVAAGEMRKNGALDIFAGGTCLGATNKTVRLYFGGSLATSFSTGSGTVNWWLRSLIYNRNAENAQGVLAQIVVSGATPTIGFGTMTIDTSATGSATQTAQAITVKVTGQKGAAGDTLTSEILTVWLIPSLT